MSSADDAWIYLHNLWRDLSGLPDVPEPTPKTTSSLEHLRVSESEKISRIDSLCLDRLVLGALRYGPMCSPGKPQYNRVIDMHRRLRNYAKTGNTENLVDVVNLARLEVLEGDHPNRHFGTGFEGKHTEERSR
jgi:hypothetical protein